MTNAARRPPSTLITAVWPAAQGAVGATVLCMLGSLALALSAKLQVPFWPVPMTLQTLVLQLLATAFGWRLGGATVLLYLVEGAVGLPVFAGSPERGIGLAYLVGPTAGYLLGFLPAAIAMGWLAERGWGRSLARGLLIGLAGNAIVIAMGAAWLAQLLGATKALDLGVVPFLLATGLKSGLGAALVVAGWQLARPRR